MTITVIKIKSAMMPKKFFSKIKQNHENLNFLLCVNSAQYSNKNNGIIMYCYPVIYFLLEEPEHREL